MSASRQILIVEDEESVRQRMVSILRFENYTVEASSEVAEAIRKLDTHKPDVILCDITMPRGDGVDLVSFVRSRADLRLTPIVMVTALTERRWQRRFMELGADDYLTKPFRAAELVGTVETQCAKLSWREQELAAASADRLQEFAGITFDPLRRTLIDADRIEKGLTVREAELLTILLEHRGETISRAAIMEAMGREFDAQDRIVDVRIGHLRRLMGDDSRNPRIIRTVRGKGYMLDASGDLLPDE